MFDFIVRNGLLVDGSGNPAYRADVGVRDDIIVAIGDLSSAEAKDSYDAEGKYVIPGLIDPHLHEEWVCMVDGTYGFLLKEGVTTVVNGNCGHSIVPGPLENILQYYYGNGLMSGPQVEKYLKTFPRWDDFAGYAESVASRGSNVNFATLLGHGTLRWSVMNGAHQRKPSPYEALAIEKHIRHNMDQGAFGISFGLDYVPSRYADLDELCDTINIINEYDGVSACHLRHYIGIYESTEEYLEAGRRTGAKIQISHLASTEPEAFDLVKKAIEEEGVRARIDTIPDSLGHCTSKPRLLQFVMALSDELFAQGIEGVKRALKDPAGREVIKQDAYIFAGDKSSKYIINSGDPHLENRSVADIAAERGQDPDETMLDLLADDVPYTFWMNAPAANTPSKFVDHVDTIVNNPYVSVGSDEIMGDVEDPFDWYELRRRGSFPIFTQRYLSKGVPYEEIVRRNTSMVAEHFGIHRRGRIAQSYFADLAVIDLENYSYPEVDQNHYKNPLLEASGCDLVLVNGEVSLRDGQVDRTFAGRVLKKNNPAI